jgi:hypothetical protein
LRDAQQGSASRRASRRRALRAGAQVAAISAAGMARSMRRRARRGRRGGTRVGGALGRNGWGGDPGLTLPQPAGPITSWAYLPIGAAAAAGVAACYCCCLGEEAKARSVGRRHGVGCTARRRRNGLLSPAPAREGGAPAGSKPLETALLALIARLLQAGRTLGPAGQGLRRRAQRRQQCQRAAEAGGRGSRRVRERQGVWASAKAVGAVVAFDWSSGGPNKATRCQ